MSFRDDLTDDLNANFFNVEEFGETATLQRGNAEATLQCLYDTPVDTDDSVGPDVSAVEHFPRLFVRQADLPGGKPSKDDKFVLGATQFHSAIVLICNEFVFEKDGVVVYRCKYGAPQCPPQTQTQEQSAS